LAEPFAETKFWSKTKFPLSESLSQKVWCKYIFRLKLSLTDHNKVGQIRMEEIALTLSA